MVGCEDLAFVGLEWELLGLLPNTEIRAPFPGLEAKPLGLQSREWEALLAFQHHVGFPS